MKNDDEVQQDQRHGGYGDSTGGQAPRPERKVGQGAGEGGGAGGRESPVTDSVDADEALGNRTGGYGGNPPSQTDQPDGGIGT
jgi:hypothetical protein